MVLALAPVALTLDLASKVSVQALALRAALTFLVDHLLTRAR